jgi:hypothetical protein
MKVVYGEGTPTTEVNSILTQVEFGEDADHGGKMTTNLNSNFIQK